MSLQREQCEGRTRLPLLLLLLLFLKHEQFTEIIHPPPHSLYPHPGCQHPPSPPPALCFGSPRMFIALRFLFFSTLPFDAHAVTHAGRQTVEAQAPSISVPHPLPSAFPFIHQQTGDTLILCLLFRPSLDNLPSPSPCVFSAPPPHPLL